MKKIEELIRLMVEEEVDRMINRSAGTFMPTASHSPIMMRSLEEKDPEDDSYRVKDEEVYDDSERYVQTVVKSRRNQH